MARKPQPAPKPKTAPKPKPDSDEDEAAESPAGGGLRLFGKTIALPKISMPDFGALGRKVLGEKLGSKLFGGAKKSDGDEEAQEDEHSGRKQRGKDSGDDAEEGGDDEGSAKKKNKLAQIWGGLDKRKKIVVAGVGGLLVLIVIGGGTWWFLGKTKPAPMAPRQQLEAGARLRSALSPPPGEEAAEAAAGKGKAKGKAAPAAKGGGLNALVTPQGAGGMLVVPAVNQDAFTKLPLRRADPPLAPAPDIALIEKASDGSLPRVGRDGRRSWQVYARPGPAADDARPRVAIIVSRLGFNRPGGIETIRRLPGEVSLAFDPAAPGLPDWVSRARQVGHEVLLVLPARPINFPIADEGPGAIQASVPPEDNIKRMETVMLRSAGYIGLLLTPGADVVTNEQALRPVLKAMHDRGLMVIDGGGAPNTLVPRVAVSLGQPAAIVDLAIDADPSRVAIDARLTELETLARNGKAAIGVAHALPVTLERLIDWIPTLEKKGIVLAPASAIAGRQVR